MASRSIIYIGDFRESFSTENYVAYGLRENGCRVLKVQDSDITDPRQVLGGVQTYGACAVLFSKCNFALAIPIVSMLKEHGIPTVTWLFDLFLGAPSYFGRRSVSGAAFRCDLTVMTDGGHLEEWRQNRVNHRLLRQGIHEPEAHYGKKQEGHPEIVFIGSHSYQERVHLVNFLKQRYGNRFTHYGKGGMRHEVRGEELNDVLASCKIVVGDSVPSPHYWSNRVYEVTGRGGFLMHPYVDGLQEEFEDGKHYVGYRYGDFEGLAKKIDYYLTHDEERETIRKAGHERTKNDFTYTKRCECLLSYIDGIKPQGNA